MTVETPAAPQAAAARPASASRCGPDTPMSKAWSSGTGSGSPTRSTARASRPSCSCPPGRSSIRGTGSCRSPTSPGTRGSTFDGRGNGRSDRPADPEAYREEEFAADALAVMDATGDRARRAGRRCRGAPNGRCSSPRITPSGSRGSPSSLRRSRCAPRSSGEGERGVPRAARDVSRLGEVQPPLLGRALRGLPRVLLLAMPDRAALDETARGHRRMGSRHGRPTLIATQLAPRLRNEARRPGAAVPVDCPILVIHGQRRPGAPVCVGCATRRAGERRARRLSKGRATSPMPATRSRSTCCSATSSGRWRDRR